MQLRVWWLVAATLLVPMMAQAAPKAALRKKPAATKPWKLTISEGYNLTSGDYGLPDSTQMTYLPTTAKLKYQHWTAKLTVPYLSITGPGNVVGEDVVLPGGSGERRTESGLGDVLTSVAYARALGKSGASYELMGRVKLPTADEKRRLGTGKSDYTAQLTLTQTVAKRGYVSVNGGRKFNNHTARAEYDDVWRYGAAMGYKWENGLLLGAAFDHRDKSLPTSHDFEQLTYYVAYPLSDDWSVQGYVSDGMTKSAADVGAGFQLNYQFDAFAL